MKQLPDKIDPLIRRLATDSDGETVACVRAIERVLKSVGMTFHDLADRLQAPAQASSSRYSYADDYAAKARAAAADAERRRREAAERAASGVPGQFATWIGAVEWLLDGQRLSDRETEFLNSLAESLPRWHRPTEKQEKWLRDILKRFGVE